MLCGNFIIKDFPVMLYFYFYIKNVGCRLTIYDCYPNIYYRTKNYIIFVCFKATISPIPDNRYWGYLSYETTHIKL